MSKKILFITYENPFTRDLGDSIYTCNVLDGLVVVAEYVDIIYFDSNPKEAEINKKELLKFRKVECVHWKQKKRSKFVFSSFPGMLVNRYSKEYLARLEKMLSDESYTHIFVNHLKMMYTVPSLLKMRRKSKLIYLSHNVEYLLSKGLAPKSIRGLLKSPLKQFIRWQDFIKTKTFEKKWITDFDAVTAITEHDADYFKSDYKVSEVLVLRPFFDIDSSKVDPDKKKINQLIIGGSFTWYPKEENLELFLGAKNFNLLNENGLNIQVVGRAYPPFVNYINNKYEGVEMTGEVEDLIPFYDQAKIAIIPEYLGGGFKLKIIEAAQTKTAIFAIKGAIKKCKFIKGIHYIEFDSFEELISEIIYYQNKAEQLDEMIENAYQLVKKEFTLDKLVNTLKVI